MYKLFAMLFCTIALFSAGVGAFKVDINKVPPECRNSIRDMETYSACMKGLKAKTETPSDSAPEANNQDDSEDDGEE